MRQLPPLNALRAFESAARHLSFQKAARELFVTPSAVSHQIKTLEENLGVTLFRRLTRKITLTAEGRSFFATVGDALDMLEGAAEQLRAPDRPKGLTVSVAPTFAGEWLVPRLGGFQTLHPEIDLRLSNSRDVPDFIASDIDVAIPRGNGRFPGLKSHKLMDEKLVVVCAPKLTRGRKGLRALEDLRNTHLIHVLLRPDQWRMTLEPMGVEGVEFERGITVESSTLALDAAMSGVGVALANRNLIGNHLSAGRLVVPFDLGLPESGVYYLVYPPQVADDARVVAFRSWLLGTLRRPRATH